jgi:hypothetical protein
MSKIKDVVIDEMILNQIEEDDELIDPSHMEIAVDKPAVISEF